MFILLLLIFNSETWSFALVNNVLSVFYVVYATVTECIVK